MTNKLFAPQVEQSIPACTVFQEEEVTSTTLLIPFELNKAVSWVDMPNEHNISLILKTVSTGKILIDNLKGEIIKFNTTTNTPAAKFEIPKAKFLPELGQYYKAQIAFINVDEEVGHYSDATVVKFTAQPEVYIQDLTNGINQAQYTYTGVYETIDNSEKVYWYEFNIYDASTGLLYDSSGQQVHNSSTDTDRNCSWDAWTSYKTLADDRPYVISYKITTVNGLIIESPGYNIVAMDTLDLIAKNTEFIATLNPEDAYVHIHLLPKDIDADIKAITGNFVLTRASSEDNFLSWHEIYKFTLVNNYPLMTLWKDFTVQQGCSYKYAIQAYNSKKVYSNRLECKYYACEADERSDDIARKNWNSNPKDPLENTNLVWHYLMNPDGTPTSKGLPIDFEDAFLYDGKRQLKIRYNPRVSSFKTTILESKVNTIGGKFPFIFKNGNTSYKEFPISGLITLLTDENSLFTEQLKRADYSRKFTFTPPYSKENDGWWYSIAGQSEFVSKLKQEEEVYDIQTFPTADNFKREREFKLEVLNWLNDGKPKLFRSPGEGNYIVRLMNTSLSPNDTLGRMLHTFSTSACEIAEYNFINLEKYGFINARDTDYQELKFKMLNLWELYQHKSIELERTDNVQYTIEGGAYYLAIIDQYAHWALKVTYANGTSVIVNCGNSTGQYVFDAETLKGNPIVSITSLEGVPGVEAKILYGYYDTSEIAFSLISHVTKNMVIDQIIGHPETRYRDDSYNLNYISSLKNGIGYYDRAWFTQTTYGTVNIPHRVLGKFYYLKAEPRTATEIYFKNNKYYHTPQCIHEIVMWDDSDLYKVMKHNGIEWIFDKQYSGRPQNNIILEEPNYFIKINASAGNGKEPVQEQCVDLSLRGGSSSPFAPITSGRYEIYFDLDKIESVYIGSGVKCELCYNITTTHYEVEEQETFLVLRQLRENLTNSKNAYEQKIIEEQSRMSEPVEALRLTMEEDYHKYIQELERILDELQKEENSYYAL